MREAVAWIDASVPTSAVIVGRDAMWAELHDPGARDQAFPSYVSYWRLAYDPRVRARLLGAEGWRAVGYVVVSKELLGGPAPHPEQVVEIWAAELARSRPRARRCSA